MVIGFGAGCLGGKKFDKLVYLVHLLEDFPELDQGAVSHIKKAIEQLKQGKEVDTGKVIRETLDLFP